MASEKSIVKYIKEHYPDHLILEQSQQKKPYDRLNGHMVKLNGILWYIRVLPSADPETPPKIEFTRANLVYKPSGEHF
ncbi:MAG TPA: hypothetical protein VJ939_00805 [Bacteroidales bacterium]|nr:hypothetical protein [Bacteroidales bacterium]